MNILQYVPLAETLKTYNSTKFTSDLVAAVVVTIMLIPQSLAYAMLAGLPPEYGLYASIVPIIIYSLLGTSNTLAVGPVAVASIMTASSLATVTQQGIIGYVDGAIMLALLSGLFLFGLGLFKFGFVSNFLSHAVVSGFITASGLLIALSQMKHIMGVKVSGHSFYEIFNHLIDAASQTNFTTLAIGIGSLIFLVLSKKFASKLLQALGFAQSSAQTIARIAPVIGVIGTIIIVATWSLDQKGVAVVGSIPKGIGAFQLPSWNMEAIKALLMPAIFISIIGYVESISVGRTLAEKRKERINPNQELLALGGSNIASGLFGAFPVTGGFSRSVVNFQAGAQTPIAGILTAIGIALASYFLTAYLFYLPIAMLAATIIVAVLTLVDFSILKESWHFSRSDFYAATLTIVITLLMGVEAGVGAGIICSVLLHFYHTSRPYVAEIGLVEGSTHFRNIDHYKTHTVPEIVSLRIDESFIFSNVQYIEDYIENMVNVHSKVRELILHCGAVNTIDLSGLELLIHINEKLSQAQINLNLAELKTPLRQQLSKTHFLEQLTGSLYLSHYDAYKAKLDEYYSNFTQEIGSMYHHK